MSRTKNDKRIGIYAGTFDPVHGGHVAFALQAQQTAKLDNVYFMPERRPRDKIAPTHFGHRVAMLRRALKPYAAFNVLEMVDVSFNVEHTLPALRRLFPGSELVFLLGSDVAINLADWPMAERLLKNGEFVIGLRSQDERQALHNIIEAWPSHPKTVTVLESYAPEVSSGKVRSALRHRQPVAGLLSSVERYSNRNWLYISLG